MSHGGSPLNWRGDFFDVPDPVGYGRPQALREHGRIEPSHDWSVPTAPVHDNRSYWSRRD